MDFIEVLIDHERVDAERVSLIFFNKHRAGSGPHF